MKIIGVIPARYNSKRLPGKPLIKIHGKTLIELTYTNLIKMELFDSIYIATDSEQICNKAKEIGASAIMTSIDLKNGTERCNEAIKKLGSKISHDDIIINIQCDEPFVKKKHIQKILSLFTQKTHIGTLVSYLKTKDINIPSVVKVNLDKNNQALIFSRFIHDLDNTQQLYKHIGIYAYRKDTLNLLSNLPATIEELEQKLEQMRWINTHYNITCGVIKDDILSINTEDDLKNI
jgi:3-deoxy-manno-octulosonate cytidylyltransferase (CMP-KDO synthetase)